MELLGMPAYKKLRSIFYLFLVTMAVYLINSLFIFYINGKLIDYLPPGLDEINIPQQESDKIRPYEYFKRIWERNLFSVTIDENEKVSDTDLMSQLDNLSLTSLNCTLIGTIINESGNSWAIIQDNQSKAQDKYTVGSTISGAKVVMILRNKVVLNIDGKDELLVMGIEKIRAEKSGDKNANQVDSKADITTYKISRDFVQESINNVAQIMSQVRIKPYFKEGKPEGFIISRIKEGSLVKTMGFEDGDIIKSVNGQQVHSAEDIIKLYNTLKDSNLFSISIKRNDQAKTLNFKVR